MDLDVPLSHITGLDNYILPRRGPHRAVRLAATSGGKVKAKLVGLQKKATLVKALKEVG